MHIWWWGMAAVWASALCAADLSTRRLPNMLTLPGAVAIIIAAAYGGHGAGALAGGVLLAVLYLGVHLLRPRAMGAGDVKLALGLGAAAGAAGAGAWWLAAFLAPAITGTVGLVHLLRGRRRTGVPHGPAMCVATAVAIIACSAA